MADITSGLVGALTATAIIVVVGEISPQAACSRYGLQIGSKLVPLVQVFRFMLLPVAWPISKLLDIVLGQELGTYHSKQVREKTRGRRPLRRACTRRVQVEQLCLLFSISLSDSVAPPQPSRSSPSSFKSSVLTLIEACKSSLFSL